MLRRAAKKTASPAPRNKLLDAGESLAQQRDEIFTYAAYRVQLASMAKAWVDAKRSSVIAWKRDRK